MKGLTEEQENFFNKLRAELSKQDQKYSFKIGHHFNIKPSKFYVALNITPDALCGVIAYIEYITFDITSACSYSLSERELMEIINKFYFELEILDEEPKWDNYYYEIDLYFNWEYHSGFPYDLGMPELHREGLLEYTKEMAIRNNWRQEPITVEKPFGK